MPKTRFSTFALSALNRCQPIRYARAAAAVPSAPAFLRGQNLKTKTQLAMRWWTRMIITLGACHLVLSTGAAEKSMAATRGAEPLRAVVPKLNGKISVDGRLDERVWQRAAVLGPFQLNGGSGEARVVTHVRVWYDDQAIYLGWVCQDRDIQATFTNRDSHFWEEEVCEFFVTAGDLARYFELQWNPLGGVFDAIIHNELGPDRTSKKFTGDWAFTAHGMQHKVVVQGTVGKSDDRDTGWRAEVRIPFADLGRSTPKRGEEWRANFYRFNRDTGQPAEPLAWSPTRDASFHQPSRFGYLEFGKGSVAGRTAR